MGSNLIFSRNLHANLVSDKDLGLSRVASLLFPVFALRSCLTEWQGFKVIESMHLLHFSIQHSIERHNRPLRPQQAS